jgi:hypothetical protein
MRSTVALQTARSGGAVFFRQAGKLTRASVHAVLIAATVLTVATAQSLPTDQPAVGDTHVYRVINAYNNETRGQVSYRIDKVDADRVVMAVTTEAPGINIATTEVYAPDGNWLRHPVTNRDQPVDYEFAPAYPAYQLPLEPGREWSFRVNAVNPATGERRSVRVDATVLGAERIRVPAGDFDTLKIRRTVYAGDAENHLRLAETTISELEWYAPTLQRHVRLVSDSYYKDYTRRQASQTMRGDWNIYELVSAPPAR